MMKKLLCAWIALALLLSAACGLGESLFVDIGRRIRSIPSG